jgi:hypothetical protein
MATERHTQVHSAMAVEPGADFAVGGETDAVAVSTEKLIRVRANGASASSGGTLAEA